MPNHRISVAVQGTGLIFFGVLFYLCRRFAFERMLAYDGAYYIFQLIHSHHLFAGPSRYGDYLPQLLPYLALKQGWSLRTIVILYSVSLILVHYLFFLIVTLVLKNNGAGIAIMLISCLTYYHAFYAPMLQLSETMPAAILLWALVHPETPYSSKIRQIIYFIAAFVVIVYISFTHPLGIIAVMFVIGLEIVGAKRFNDLLLWALLILGVGWLLLKDNYFFKEQYNQNQILPFHELISHVSGWKNWSSTQFVEVFTQRFQSVKWLAIICLIFSIRKGILFTLFLLAAFAGFTFLLIANYQHGTSFIVYESYYLMYGFFVGLTFVFLFYHPNRKLITLLISIPFLFTGVKRIYRAHSQYSDRLAYLERTVRQAHRSGGKKYIVDSRCYPGAYGLTSWNFAIETLLYSSLQGPDSSLTVFIERPEFKTLCDTGRTMQNIFLGVYFCPLWFTANDMPLKYFRLPSTPYADLTHSQDDTSFHEDFFSAANLKIVPTVSTIHAYLRDWTVAIPLEIINSSGHTIPAIPRKQNPVLIGLKLVDEQGKIIFDEVANPLETDVGSVDECAITLYLPALKGTFYAQPDLLTEGVRWWHIPSQRVKIILE